MHVAACCGKCHTCNFCSTMVQQVSHSNEQAALKQCMLTHMYLGLIHTRTPFLEHSGFAAHSTHWNMEKNNHYFFKMHLRHVWGAISNSLAPARILQRQRSHLWCGKRIQKEPFPYHVFVWTGPQSVCIFKKCSFLVLSRVDKELEALSSFCCCLCPHWGFILYVSWWPLFQRSNGPSVRTAVLFATI